MQPVWDQYTERGLKLVLVTAESREVMARITASYELPALVLADPRGRLARLFNVPGYPSGFLFDEEGRLLKRYTGWSRTGSLEDWKHQVEQALED